ncbi:MAG TPA: CheR family methyltransferase [Steroidobacteraceae bacterium]|nr:CheR family methyltransferase [Steroidobacteraceae bacterium]
MAVSPEFATQRLHRVPASADALDTIFAVLREKAGFDLRGYKLTPLVCRVQQRLELLGLRDFGEYAALLQQDSAEVAQLVREIPVHVTQFFRDSPAWKTLETQVVDRLFCDRSPSDPIRAWSAACASGEEAYSVAILLAERADRSRPVIDFRVFATDASQDIVVHASRGIFTPRALTQVAADRRERFFEAHGAEQQVRKSLRQKLVFAAQHLITDAPFGDLDLVICRNLLIYLDSAGKSRVMLLIHSALRTGGYLFLGAGEHLPVDYPGFATVSAEFRIYRKITRGAAENSSERNWSEELQISHEKLDASREELRATNQELNLSGKELHAANAQLRGKMDELQTQADILSSAGIMVLCLDDDLRVRWFTTAIGALFPLLPGDIGRQITDLTPRFHDPDFIRDVREVMRTGALSENAVLSADRLWYARRILPFHAGSNPRKGVAITFTDITGRVDAEDVLRESEAQLKANLAAILRLRAVQPLSQSVSGH